MADKKNSEGYSDPTVYQAERNMERDEKAAAEKAERIRRHNAEIEKKANRLVGAIKLLADMAGFDIVSRIHVRHRKSGKEFR